MKSVSHGLWKEKWGRSAKFYKEHKCANFLKNSELLSTCLGWKIARTLLPVVDKNNHLSKEFLSLFYKWKALAHVNPCFPLQRAFLLLYVESSSSNFKHLLESMAVVLSAMCLSQNMVNCGITLMLVSLIFLLLVFSWTREEVWCMTHVRLAHICLHLMGLFFAPSCVDFFPSIVPLTCWPWHVIWTFFDLSLSIFHLVAT
jgi:hypothetical protein